MLVLSEMVSILGYIPVGLGSNPGVRLLVPSPLLVILPCACVGGSGIERE